MHSPHGAAPRGYRRRIHSLLLLWQRPVAQNRDRRSSPAHARGSTSILFLLKHMDRYIAESREMETVPEMIWAAPAEALPSPASVGQPCPPRAIRCLEAVSDLGRAGHKSKTESGSSSDQAPAKGSKSPAMPGQGSCCATAPLCPGVGVPGLPGPLRQRGRCRQPEPRLLPAGAQRCLHV